MYIGGKHKVNVTIKSYGSYEYPCERFRPILRHYFRISYDQLGKRKTTDLRSKKQVIKLFKELEINPLKVKDLLKESF